MCFRIDLLLLSFCFFAYSLFSHAGEPSESVVVVQIKKSLAKKIAHIPVEAVVPTAMPGIYQVRFRGGEIAHTDAKGRYLLAGDLFELSHRGMVNLTEKTRSADRIKVIAGLDARDMVTFSSKGDAKGVLYVFTDTDCGYCRKFHVEVPQLNAMGVEVRYLAWPRSGVKSGTGKTMVNIWCSSDPQGAMTLAKQGQKLPESESCKHGIQEQIKLGYQLGVRGTPAIFLANGKKVGGYRSAKELVAELGL